MSSQECDSCGAPADTVYEGYPMCFHCEEHVRESAEEEEIYGVCDDCGVKDAERLFLHLDGRRFHLCVGCYYAADHEEDYLMFCECKKPMCTMGGTNCARCNHKIRSCEEQDEEYEEDSYYEEDVDEEEWGRPVMSY